MSAALLLPAAVALDLLLGDPVTRWHPVRLLGNFANYVEARCNRRSHGYWSGALAFTLVVGSAVSLGALFLKAARLVSPGIELVAGVFMVYVSLAPRDLAFRANRVVEALEQHNLAESRCRVGEIVGRDTDCLDAPEVARAAVETVAESTVDGVTAPLFWACLLGPLGAFGYRAINTLDSMWGHRDERYARFGAVAARADDCMNYIPARLTLGWITLAALCLGLHARAAFRTGWRHGPRHASPNSGLSEAAFAGALAITLGGHNRYDGEWHAGPTFGTQPHQPNTEHLRKSIRLMWITTFVALATLTTVRVAGQYWVAP